MIRNVKGAPVTMARVVEDFGWLGEIIALHKIGEYAIVEYWNKPASNSIDRNTYKAWGGYVDGVNTSHIYSTLDEALAGCIAYKHEGLNHKANIYFIRSISADSFARERKL